MIRLGPHRLLWWGRRWKQPRQWNQWMKTCCCWKRGNGRTKYLISNGSEASNLWAFSHFLFFLFVNHHPQTSHFENVSYEMQKEKHPPILLLQIYGNAKQLFDSSFLEKHPPIVVDKSMEMQNCFFFSQETANGITTWITLRAKFGCSTCGIVGEMRCRLFCLNVKRPKIWHVNKVQRYMWNSGLPWRSFSSPQQPSCFLLDSARCHGMDLAREKGAF